MARPNPKNISFREPAGEPRPFSRIKKMGNKGKGKAPAPPSSSSDSDADYFPPVEEEFLPKKKKLSVKRKQSRRSASSPLPSAPSSAPFSPPSPDHSMNLGYDPLRFVSKDASLLFDKYVSRKRIVYPGSRVIISDFDHYNFRNFIEYQGLTSLVTLHNLSFDSACLYFYANLEIIETSPPRISSYFYGTSILLDPTTLGQILDLPSSGLDVYHYNISDYEYPVNHSSETANLFLHSNPNAATLVCFETSDLKPYQRLFANLLHQSVFTNEGRSGFFGCTKLLTYLVLHNYKINFPSLILRSIIAFQHKPNSHLGHGKVISLVLKSFDCDLSSFEGRSCRDFGTKNIKLSKIPKDATLDSEGTTLHPSHSAPPSSHHRSRHAPSSSQAPSSSHVPSQSSASSFVLSPEDENRIVDRISQRVEKTQKKYYHKLKRFFVKCFQAQNLPLPSSSSSSSNDHGDNDGDENQ